MLYQSSKYRLSHRKIVAESKQWERANRVVNIFRNLLFRFNSVSENRFRNVSPRSTFRNAEECSCRFDSINRILIACILACMAFVFCPSSFGQLIFRVVFSVKYHFFCSGFDSCNFLSVSVLHNTTLGCTLS